MEMRGPQHPNHATPATAKQRIERGFERWGELIYRSRWGVIAATVLIALGLGSQLGRLETDTSTENYLRSGDPVRAAYDAFREQFGRDTVIAIVIEPPEIFDLGFLRKLRAFHETLESQVPKLQSVTSLVNIRNTRGEGDQLIVEDLLEDFPETPEQLATFRERVLTNPLYRDLVISADGTLTTVTIETDVYSSIDAHDDLLAGFDEEEGLVGAVQPPFITSTENAQIVLAVQDIASRFESPDFRLYVGGGPVLMEFLSAHLQHDLTVFLCAALLTITALLLLLFRRMAGIILPLLVVVLSVISILGIMAIADIPISIPSQILPSFLLSVGIGYSVHLLVIYLQRFEACQDPKQSLCSALAHCGIPIVMTGVTTIVGFLSFTTSSIAHINTLGIITPLGVLICLLYSLIFLPALIAAVPPSRHKSSPDQPGRLDRVLLALGRVSSRHPRKVVLASAALAVIALIGALQLRFSHNPVSWIPKHSAAAIATDVIDQRLGGASPMEIIIDTGRENGLHEPDLLNRIERLHRRVERFIDEGEEIGKAISIADIIRESHQALNENRAEYYAIPQDRELIAQEFLLFENSGSDDLEDIVDSGFRKTRFTLRTPQGEAFDKLSFVHAVDAEFHRIMGDDVELSLTGLTVVMVRTADAVITSMSRSYTVALLLITPLMILMIGSLRDGLVSMVPNLLPILITLGLMGLADIPLDVFTLMIGCIAIGLAVDDTIHFIHSFQRYYARHHQAELAIEQTLRTTGKALLFTSVVLSAGFFIFTLSTLGNLTNFGLLTGFAISVAFIADVTATPALLVLVSRSRQQPPPREEG
jgi:hydrophobe/amphiphile efflux-3 (HAE3) family protein